MKNKKMKQISKNTAKIAALTEHFCYIILLIVKSKTWKGCCFFVFLKNLLKSLTAFYENLGYLWEQYCYLHKAFFSW